MKYILLTTVSIISVVITIVIILVSKKDRYSIEQPQFRTFNNNTNKSSYFYIFSYIFS